MRAGRCGIEGRFVSQANIKNSLYRILALIILITKIQAIRKLL